MSVLSPLARGPLEPGGDLGGPALPDDALGLGEHVAPLVPLGQVQVEVAVLAPQLTDLGPDPFRVGQALLDGRPDLGQKVDEGCAPLGLGRG